jgi:hypothetical protein
MSEPFIPHPNLSDTVNDGIARSEAEGGAWIEKLAVGKRLLVKTQNTLYTVERREDGLYIWGSRRFCPAPTKCVISGSTWGGSMLKIGFIGIGMFMEFNVDGHKTLTTSLIKEITEI